VCFWVRIREGLLFKDRGSGFGCDIWIKSGFWCSINYTRSLGKSCIFFPWGVVSFSNCLFFMFAS
jgi:hypothetical protein